jgi:hypothetical protein
VRVAGVMRGEEPGEVPLERAQGVEQRPKPLRLVLAVRLARSAEALDPRWTSVRAYAWGSLDLAEAVLVPTGVACLG